MNKSYFKNKSVLITGGSGYIGSKLAEALISNCQRLISLDSKTDLTSILTWKKNLKDIDIIFHLAAQTSLNFAAYNPLKDIKINLLPTVTLIETCIKYGLYPDIVFTGTVTEVGLTKKTPVNETFQDNPLTIYDLHKLFSEKYLKYYTEIIGGKAVTLRLANVYGPGGINKRNDRGIVNQMIKKALYGEDLTLYNRGQYLRDYIFIDDVITALIISAIKISKLSGKYFIIGTDKGHTLKQLAIMIVQKAQTVKNSKTRIKYLSGPKGLSKIEYRNFIADSSSFRRLTKWINQYNLDSGLNKTINSFIRNKHFI